MDSYIDFYCERIGPGIWEEPFNLLSNLAFVVMIYYTMRLIRPEHAPHGEIAALLFLVAGIGISTALFHALATGWASFVHNIFIFLFLLVYLPSYSLYVMGHRHRLARTAAFIISFSLLQLATLAYAPANWVTGSFCYAPAFLFLIGLGIYHRKTQKNGPNLLLFAAVIFTVSYLVNMLDIPLCDYFPIGLHHFWHIFNAVVLYIIFKAYLLNAKRA